MGQAIQEAEDVVEGAFEALEEPSWIAYDAGLAILKLPVHPFTPVPSNMNVVFVLRRDWLLSGRGEIFLHGQSCKEGSESGS